jgi:hypothetical protein
MDVAPPQAPPAIVGSTQQATLDALGRLVAVQGWLDAQQKASPALPAQATPEGRDTWLSRLDAFWRQPVEGAPGMAAVPRIDALATRLASVMRDDALVRRADSSLTPLAANLAERFARSRGGGLPPGIEARSLRLGSSDYAGAVIVLDRSDPSLVLRFMPDRGWDVFDSVDHLHVDTETRWRQILAHQRELAGVRADDIARLIAGDRFVTSAAMEGDVFLVIAQRIATLQREKIDDAWPSAQEPSTSPRFTDEANAALDLHDKIDIFAMLAEREARLAATLDEERLARVPVGVARDWRSAAEGYRLARLHEASIARQHVDDAPLTLAAWSRKELVTALLRRRIDIDPDDIQIDVSGSEELTLPTGGAPLSTPSGRMSLAEFALRNTSYLDNRRLRVVSGGQTPDSSAPGMPLLREVARELNLAPRFEAYLRAQVSDPHGRRFRLATMRLQQARMRVEAAAARVTTYLRDEPSAFVDDREERGYRMVEAVLDGPAAASRRTVGGHRVAVRQLVYRGAVVSDVLVIGADDARSSPRIVLYTPGAPDGRHFREFSDRATAGREFLYAPAFQAYLLNHLPSEYGESLPSGSGRRFRVSEATRRSHWVLAAPGEGRGTMTEEAFEERVVGGDVRTALFDAEIVRQARDVAWVGRSSAEADTEAVVAVVDLVRRAFRGPASLAEDTAGAVDQALRATWRFYDSVKAGDHARAFIDFTEAYTASLGVAGWYAGIAGARQPRLSLRVEGSGSRRADAGIRLSDARQWLDARYATRGVDLHNVCPDASGVHRLAGRRYIRQQELVFEIRRDAASDTWRLTRPNALDAAYPGPAVEPMLAGGWRLHTPPGLRGGWTDGGTFPQPSTRYVHGRDLDGLTEFQRWTFQQSLSQRLRNGGEASLIYWEATAQPSARWVTLRQRTAWNDALRTARTTPPEPLPIGTQAGPTGSWRVLSPDEWPTQLWHYPTGAGIRTGDGGPLVLTLQALPGSGLVGLPATSQAPAGASGGTWIRLHLDRYRSRLGNPGSPGLTIIENRHGPGSTYVIQPDVGAPLGYLGLEVGDFTVGGRSLSSPLH